MDDNAETLPPPFDDEEPITTDGRSSTFPSQPLELPRADEAPSSMTPVLAKLEEILRETKASRKESRADMALLRGEFGAHRTASNAKQAELEVRADNTDQEIARLKADLQDTEEHVHELRGRIVSLERASRER